MWARKYDKCIRCGRTSRKHQALGLCDSCYVLLRLHLKNPKMGFRNRWALYHDKCKRCGTTKTRHRAKGLCRNCYIKVFRTDKLRKYYREYWKKNPDKYAKLKRQMREYQQTREGKKSMERAMAKLREKNPKYHADYSKQWRKKKAKQGLCINCGKIPSREGYKTCGACGTKFNKASKKWRQKNAKMQIL